MKTTHMAGRTWHYSHCLGRMTGEHNGKTGGFAYPMDVACAGDDILFVISRGMGMDESKSGKADFNRRIGKTTIDELHFGDFARGEFTWPTSIDVAGDGNVYVADEYHSSISFFAPDRIMTYPEADPDGESLGSWGEPGSEEGQLKGPTGIEFDEDDNLYVVDSRNDRVQKFTKAGEYISGWGAQGGGPGEFDRPWGITVDGAGDVYVADWGNHRVQKFDAEGNHLLTFGGDGLDVIKHPSAVAVDSEGDVYVVDWGNRRVQIFDPAGDVITALYGDADGFSKAGIYNINRDPESMKKLNASEGTMERLATFGRPLGIAIDEKDRVIVTDARGRLLVYAKDKDYAPPTV